MPALRPTLSATSAICRVRMVEPAQLTERDVQAWSALEARAIEPNAYLSPHFVLPAVRHLDAASKPLVFLTERFFAGQRELVGAAVLQRAPRSRHFPMSHWVGYLSKHSFLSGLLLDRERARESLAALLAHIHQRRQGNGIELPRTWGDGPVADAIERSMETGNRLHVDANQPRAVLEPAQAGETLLRGALAKRMKDIDRRMRRLREQGEVGVRLHREGGIPEHAVESFLALEHAGWKGEQGSSLRSRPNEERFFRETVEGFGSQARAFFVELTLDGVAIASSSNFISGHVGHAFKIGWAPAFKAFSPGVLNEVELIRHAPQWLADLDYVDSGANADSFINDLWPGRRATATATLATSPMARVLADTVSSARYFKRRWNPSRLSPMALHAAKPEWWSMAEESLTTIALSL